MDLFTIGLGYKYIFSERSSFFTVLDYAQIKCDGSSLLNGYEVTLGVRSIIADNLELKAGLEYLDYNCSYETTSLLVGAGYSFTDKIAIYSDYKHDSDLSCLDVGVLFNYLNPQAI